jgi:hypothetical protein
VENTDILNTVEEEPFMNGGEDFITPPPKKTTRAFLNYAGLLISVFTVFVVVLVMTTDISIVSFADIASLGLTFFILLLCSYVVFISCADSGSRAGEQSQAYVEAMERFNELRRRVTSSGAHTKIRKFCSDYVENELESARRTVLSGSGVSYEAYKEKYLGVTKWALRAEKKLTAKQRKAVAAANALKPIKLNSTMLMGSVGCKLYRRSPLTVNPAKQKRVGFMIRFLRVIANSLLTGCVVLDASADFSRADFAAVCFKLFAVVPNGFAGYKFGYDNVAVHTVEYLNGRSDLLEEALSSQT